MVCVGTVALDTVETPSGRMAEAPGGSALYFAAAARRWGPVLPVGVAGDDLPEAALAPLEALGVDVSGIRRLPGATFRWHVRYDEDGGRETLAAERGVTVRTPPEPGPEHRDPGALFLGSTDPGVQRAVLDAAGAPGLVALDTMAHWIRDRRAELEALLPRVDLLLVDGGELRLLGGEEDEGRAAAAVLERGLPWLVVKRGARGAAAYAGTGAPESSSGGAAPGRPARPVAEVPAAPVDRVVDPTGAGDAFAGGLVGTLTAAGGRRALDAEGLRGALLAGASMGALAVSDFSFRGLVAGEAGA